jgi:hypothetical protein
MANTPRASSSWQGNRPLADTGSGSPGELTGTERLKLQSLAAIYSIGAGLQLVGNALSTTIANATTSVAGLMSAADKAKLDGIAAGAEVNPAGAERDATAAQNGLMSAAYASKLDGIQAGAQVNPGLANSGSNGLMSSTYADKLDKVGSIANSAIGAAVSLGNGAWTLVATQAAFGNNASNTQVFGQITFRNVSGSDSIGYFQVTRADNGQLIASGQIEVRNNQRNTVGFHGVNLSTMGGAAGNTGVNLWGRAAAASGVEATHQNGMGDGKATLIGMASGY